MKIHNLGLRGKIYPKKYTNSVLRIGALDFSDWCFGMKRVLISA